MSESAQAFCYAIAIVLFLVGAVLDWAQHDRPAPLTFIAAGLAVAFFVPFYIALKAA